MQVQDTYEGRQLDRKLDFANHWSIVNDPDNGNIHAYFNDKQVVEKLS